MSENIEETLNFEKMDILVNSVIDKYQTDALAKGIMIQKRLNNIPKIEVDPKLFERLISEIIQNAIKYSFARDGYIRFEVENLEGDVEIKVKNYGVGILPSEIRSGKVFEYGVRGRFSCDRNRTGSEVGKGRIEIRSTAVGEGVSITKGTPHMTEVSVFIPHRKKFYQEFVLLEENLISWNDCYPKQFMNTILWLSNKVLESFTKLARKS